MIADKEIFDNLRVNTGHNRPDVRDSREADTKDHLADRDRSPDLTSASGFEAKVQPYGQLKATRSRIASSSENLLFDTSSAAMCTNVRHIQRMKICHCDSPKATVFKEKLSRALLQSSNL